MKFGSQRFKCLVYQKYLSTIDNFPGRISAQNLLTYGGC